MHSISVPKLQQKKEDFYGHSNNSFSGWGSSYPSRVNSGRLSDYSGSFNGSMHSQSLQIVLAQNKGSLRVLLLHENLDIWVHEAKNLPNMEMFGKLPGSVSNKIEGTMNKKITGDPYVSISVSNAVIGRTFVISNSENPVWNTSMFLLHITLLKFTFWLKTVMLWVHSSLVLWRFQWNKYTQGQ